MRKIIVEIGSLLRYGFSKIWNRQFFIFLCFLFLAAVFWIFTTLNEEYKVDLQIPVSLTNVPQNVVITTEPPATITVSARDKGFLLLSYKYGNGIKPVTIDFTNYANHDGYATIPTGDLLRQIQSQVSGSTSISGLKPQEIKIYFNFGESKRVPVRVLARFTAAEGAHVAAIHHSPDSVTVYAPRAILDTITAAYTTTSFRQSLAKTQEVSLPFMEMTGVKFVPNTTKVKVTIDRMVEKTVSVPVQQVNFPASKMLRTFPSRVNITFQVGMGMYRHVTADDFVLVVNYEDLLNNPSSRCHLSLKSLPEGVEHARISPQDVDYIIEEINEIEEE